MPFSKPFSAVATWALPDDRGFIWKSTVCSPKSPSLFLPKYFVRLKINSVHFSCSFSSLLLKIGVKFVVIEPTSFMDDRRVIAVRCLIPGISPHPCPCVTQENGHWNSAQGMQVASAQGWPGFGMCWHHSSAGSDHSSLLSWAVKSYSFTRLKKKKKRTPLLPQKYL